MNEENQQGSATNMKAQEIEAQRCLAEQLVESARISGLPDRAFFRSFTARRRRELVYNVHAASDRFGIRLQVHGSGNMRAHVRMACVSIEDGVIDEHDDENVLSWAHNGQEAVIHTRLDHRHLSEFPCAKNVMKAFLESISTQIRTTCPGGVDHWRTMMQLFAARVARERDVPIEIEMLLPLPADQTGAAGRGVCDVEIRDISDPDAPIRIHGYEDCLRDMDENMTPEAMDLMILPPGYLVCRRHSEIFAAG